MSAQHEHLGNSLFWALGSLNWIHNNPTYCRAHRSSPR